MPEKRQIKGFLALTALALALFLIIFASGIIPRTRGLLVFILIGFVAQLVDGAIGMAYGVLSNSFLLSLGVPPAPASASIHTARIFTTFASGAAHLKLGNVNKWLLKKLVIPGIIGGIIGACLLYLAPVDFIRPVVSAYLIIIGAMIIVNAIKSRFRKTSEIRYIGLLGGIGGFVDSVGGGGWGPVITSTLIVRGHNPRLTVGSVSLAKFFVTIAQGAIFTLLLGLINWEIIVGLAVGGIIAAPLSAYLCKRLPVRALALLAGLMVVSLSVRNIYTLLV